MLAFQIDELFLSKVAFCSREMSSIWIEPLTQTLDQFEINTVNRASAFLAHVFHESNQLTEVIENLHYSAKRLVQVWPRHFFMPTDGSGHETTHASGLHDATQYSNRPEALANLIYANRMGNGAVATGDGWKYRGRGLIQMTGRSNYTRASQALNMDYVASPDLVAQPLHAAKTAGWFWSTIKGNELSNNGTQEGFERLTIAINGELMLLRERAQIWDRLKVAFGAVEQR